MEDTRQVPPLPWATSNGGPLLLLSAEYLPDWAGVTVEDPFDRPRDPAGNLIPDDYERACAVAETSGYLGLIAVGSGQGLVLGDEPMQTAWWPLSTLEGILVRWQCADSEAQVVEYLQRIAHQSWEPTGIALTVASQPLYLFDSACSGSEAEEMPHLVIALDAGEYATETGFTPRDMQRLELVLHRLRRVSA